MLEGEVAQEKVQWALEKTFPFYCRGPAFSWPGSRKPCRGQAGILRNIRSSKVWRCSLFPPPGPSDQRRPDPEPWPQW